VSRLVARRVSAWALPRASAMASAKLANSTVNHSHSVICSVKPMLPAPVAICSIRMSVVNADPTSTTNMTGLRAMLRGSSFLKDSRMAA